MPRLIDVICPGCGWIARDEFLAYGDHRACPMCGQTTERLWTAASTAAVIDDDIPGGVLIKHGICHPDGSPRRYYSKSEMKREAARRGLTNCVVHRPKPGSDKSPHTSRWV